MALLHWSRWRRWHQAWARYYHYRKRAKDGRSENAPEPTALISPVLDVLWRRLEVLLPPAKRKGRPYAHDRRVVLEAIVYVMQMGCPWHCLPADFPPWQTVYAQFDRWRKSGMWDRIWEGLEAPCSTD